ncbi:voltage-dependent calcium channel gamma-1 subunit-like [Ascaphus truei]|uniref:voltage-dependent calcium channel gamma-1 subunit-like n=1 Tax=Ascaphus truei TaxID=8439 RepID=UPI003F5AD404
MENGAGRLAVHWRACAVLTNIVLLPASGWMSISRLLAYIHLGPLVFFTRIDESSCCVDPFPSIPQYHSCSYFKHFTSGENAEIFEVTTQKEYSISAAAIAIIGVGFMIMGTICTMLSFKQKLDYLLKPAGLFYIFAGICIMISAEVIRQSVQRMIDSKDTLWIEYYYSWSFACACSAFALLFLCGIALLLISLPRMPRNPWETCMDAEPDI